MKRLEFVKLTNYKITRDENIYHFVYVPPMALDTPRNNEPYLLYHDEVIHWIDREYESDEDDDD